LSRRPFAHLARHDVINARGRRLRLGSIVLIKEERSADADVVDGQQRLTSLTNPQPINGQASTQNT
jgi:hypothetical protein